MQQQMHHIIAISNKLVRPDVFLTIECNHKWPDITLPLGRTATQKPIEHR